MAELTVSRDRKRIAFMALWTENRKCMLVGRSGLQYRVTIRCACSPDAALSTVRQFYQSRRAVLQDAPSSHALAFVRGHEWVSRFSWMLPLSETWPRQIIAISISVETEQVLVEISYDVRLRFTMIAAPNALVRETRELRSILESK